MANPTDEAAAEQEARIFHDLYQLTLEKKLRDVLGPVIVELRESSKKVNPSNAQETYLSLLSLAKDTTANIFDDMEKRVEGKKQ
ncbi:MAG: hypothetical protein AAB590_01675 [Patescibacteria group bacterium]